MKVGEFCVLAGEGVYLIVVGEEGVEELHDEGLEPESVWKTGTELILFGFKWMPFLSALGLGEPVKKYENLII